MGAKVLDSHLITFHVAYRELVAGPDEVLAQLGLGRAQQRALFAIRREPGLSVGHLARRLGVTTQALHKTLAPLAASGLASVERCEADARTIRLTPAGIALEDRVTRIQHDVFARVTRRLGAKAMEEWTTTMRAIATEARQARGEARDDR